MTRHQRSPFWAFSAVPLLTAGVLLVSGATSVSAASTVTGSAFGYHSFGITLGGGAQPDVGPTPTAVLASDASNSPQSGTATTGLVDAGPATLMTSDAITVQTSGSTSAVQSTATVTDINKATTQPSTGSEQLTANSISSTCSGSGAGNSGSTTVTNGTLQTVSGNADPNPPTVVNVPVNPAPNDSISGQILISASDTESFHFVFNEQSTSGGVLTVNGVDEYFDGPTLKGNLIIGQSVCGIATSGSNGSNNGSNNGSTSGGGTSGGTSGTGGTGAIPAPATGSGVAWRFGAPLAAAGSVFVVTTGIVGRRRARRRGVAGRD